MELQGRGFQSRPWLHMAIRILHLTFLRNKTFFRQRDHSWAPTIYKYSVSLPAFPLLWTEILNFFPTTVRWITGKQRSLTEAAARGADRKPWMNWRRPLIKMCCVNDWLIWGLGSVSWVPSPVASSESSCQRLTLARETSIWTHVGLCWWERSAHPSTPEKGNRLLLM